jgi:hypothetical protein
MAERNTYLVFARREYSEPLTQIGRVEMATPASVRAAAAQQFGEDWLELVAVPENQIAWAIREE